MLATLSAFLLGNIELGEFVQLMFVEGGAVTFRKAMK